MSAPEPAKGQPKPAPDYTVDPIGYLRWHGWRPMGNPESPLTRWLDPRRPYPDGVYSKHKLFETDDKGNKIPVMVKDGQGRPIQVEQTHWAPPAEPLEQRVALEIQVERDLRAIADAERERQRKKAS